jgi:hypothetical protein
MESSDNQEPQKQQPEPLFVEPQWMGEELSVASSNTGTQLGVPVSPSAGEGVGEDGHARWGIYDDGKIPWESIRTQRVQTQHIEAQQSHASAAGALAASSGTVDAATPSVAPLLNVVDISSHAQFGSPAQSVQVWGRLRRLGDGREFSLKEKNIHIGRGRWNQCQMHHRSVSRFHASIQYDGRRALLVDEHSSNGTFINGKRIGRRKLRHGDRIDFADVSCRYEMLGVGGIVSTQSNRGLRLAIRGLMWVLFASMAALVGAWFMTRK